MCTNSIKFHIIYMRRGGENSLLQTFLQLNWLIASWHKIKFIFYVNFQRVAKKKTKLLWEKEII